MIDIRAPAHSLLLYLDTHAHLPLVLNGVIGDVGAESLVNHHGIVIVLGQDVATRWRPEMVFLLLIQLYPPLPTSHHSITTPTQPIIVL